LRPANDPEGMGNRRSKAQNPIRAPLAWTILVIGSVALWLLSGCGSDLIAAAIQAEKAGDYPAAVDLYRQELALDPHDKDAVKGLAVDLFLLRQFDEALIYQESAVRLEPGDVQLKVELAFNYLNHQGEPQKAVEVLREATRVERTARLLTFLAQAQLAAGQPQEAEVSLRSATAEDPSYAWAYALLVKMLGDQGRGAEAEAVRQTALAAGIVLQSAP